MEIIIVPMALLFTLILFKKIPWIGGNVAVALLVAGLSIGLMAGLAPGEYLAGTIDGVDRLAWVMAMSFFGAIYAETQIRIGTVQTTMSMMQRIFGTSARGLVTATILTLVLAGSVIGDGIAIATVIGFLVIHSLAAAGLKPVQIGMVILVGSSLGAVMPPISQSIVLSSSLVGTDPNDVLRIAFFTVGAGVVLAILETFRFVKRGTHMVTGLESSSSIFTLLRTRWKTLIPTAVLMVLVLLSTLWEIDVLKLIPGVHAGIVALENVPILNALVFPIVMAMILCTLVSLCFTKVRKAPVDTVLTAVKKVLKVGGIQLSAGFMVGMFYASGAVDMIAEFGEDMSRGSATVLGLVGMIALAMVTGSQSTAQVSVVPFWAPMLEQTGVSPTNIALGASHIAAAGQNFPPVGLTGFVVAGLVSGNLDKKVDPVKILWAATPNCAFMVAIGVVVLMI